MSRTPYKQKILLCPMHQNMGMVMCSLHNIAVSEISDEQNLFDEAPKY